MFIIRCIPKSFLKYILSNTQYIPFVDYVDSSAMENGLILARNEKLYLPTKYDFTEFDKNKIHCIYFPNDFYNYYDYVNMQNEKNVILHKINGQHSFVMNNDDITNVVNVVNVVNLILQFDKN